MSKTIEEAALSFLAEVHKEYTNVNSELATIITNAVVFGADFVLTHQWRSVEDELPSDDTLVIAHSPNGRVEALRYQDGVFRDELQQAHYVDYWMELPSLNPEQR